MFLHCQLRYIQDLVHILAYRTDTVYRKSEIDEYKLICFSINTTCSAVIYTYD